MYSTFRENTDNPPIINPIIVPNVNPIRSSLPVSVTAMSSLGQFWDPHRILPDIEGKIKGEKTLSLAVVSHSIRKVATAAIFHALSLNGLASL